MSIRTRIIMAAMLVAATASIIYAFYFMNKERKDALTKLHATIEVNERLLNVVTAGPLYDGNIEQLDATLGSFFANNDIVRIELTEYNGSIRMSRARTPAAIGQTVNSRVLITRMTDELGEINITYSTARIEQRLLQSRYQIILFSGVLVLGLSGVIYLVARGLTGPIDRLTDAARAMADGNLDREIDTSGVQELQSLGQSFIRMRDAIREKMDDLANQNEALKESEERLRMALTAANQGLYDLNIKTGEASVSPEYATMLGYDPAEFHETNARWIERLHPDDLERVSETYRSYVRGEIPSYEVECRQRTRTGDYKWILSLGKIVARDAEGNPLRMLGTHTDITERKLAAQEKERLEAQLLQAQKLESIGRLAGGVAHDFNNMLSVILGYAELIKSKLSDGHPLVNYVSEIEKAGIRSRDLTRQLLAFSRKQIIEPRMLNPNDLISATQKSLVRLIGEDIDLCFYPGNDVGKIRFDPTQFDQILMNLAVNARDAMPEGGRLTIETANVYLDEDYSRKHLEFRPGHYVMLAVSDNGHGMDQKTLLHIFEPFFTTKEVGKGTGLGLATVYGIVKQNGGFIYVYSEPGQGTTFKIYIPRLMEDEKEGREKAGETQVAVSAGTVLLTEDDEMVRRMTAEMLEEIGYTVLVAKTPMEALSLCEKKDTPIDLLLTDVVMPGMKGTELRDKIEALRPGIKVMFMSGYTSNVIVHHGVLQEGVHFIQKPFKINDLSRKVRDALGGR
ncbi:MAG: sensor hybrid histidine kinase [Nitrospirae bacterium]|nr:sensor hybrid histidine kinase [Nitrospirota bacterium]